MSNAPETDPAVRVAVALIERGGSYLIRRRPPGSIMAGVWEFPGGKIETGESEEVAAARESLEETGLRIEVIRCRHRAEHLYPHGRIRLAWFDCRLTDPEQEPDPATGFRWVEARDLSGLTFPEANEHVVSELARERSTSDAMTESTPELR
ncbi:MAG: (deoxy)nucleoside triphosphate pyrophosphohydrolase [Isosphaeraceae bacterium]|nr:(deoxy)nucleoside triphosphate pyrophosphohydrolase [Isosphaeraceae bacterium]